ncbi:MAG: hypothetical protein HZC41_04435 [Chloroflexi bacterium]|nr:hypothetical protein [Chloroflexota bacterium]
MQFTTTISLDACRRRLTSHKTIAPVLADTQVVIQRLPDNRTQFAVRRMWTGLQTWLNHPVMQLSGTLTPKGSARTDVTVYVEIGQMGLLLLGLAFGFLLLGLAYPNVVTAWIMVIGLAALFGYEGYTLLRIIHDLRS